MTVRELIAALELLPDGDVLVEDGDGFLLEVMGTERTPESSCMIAVINAR